MKLFMSYYSQEEADAEDIADYLRTVFRHEGLEVFMSSQRESLAPGDLWQEKVITAIEEADALVVFKTAAFVHSAIPPRPRTLLPSFYRALTGSTRVT